YEFLLAATNYICTIHITAPLTEFKPKSCASRVDNYSADTCGDFDPNAAHLCHSLNRRYLQVGSKANIFCYLCDNGFITQSFCPNDENESSFYEQAIDLDFEGIDSLHEPPFTLLLRFTIRSTISSTDDTTCILSTEWQDLK
ncbi:hypothetical protein BgiMline_003588, partial [Biomphalaria glabrata]